MGKVVEKQESLGVHQEHLMIASVVMGTFLAMINSSSMNIALPTFVKVFQTDVVTAQWVVVGYMLTTGIVTPLVGFWGDKYSCRTIFLAGLGLLAVTSLGCSFAQEIDVLIFFRVVQGIAGGFLMPVSTTIVYQFVSDKRQMMAISLVAMMNSFGFALGPSWGGALLTYCGWQSIFWFNIPVALLTMYFVLKYVPKKYISRDQRLDAMGMVLVMVGTVSILLGFSNGNQWGWTSLKVFLTVGIGVAALGYFIWHELHLEHPMLNFQVFKYRRFTYGLLMNVCSNIALCLSPFLMALYLQDVLGLSALQAGLVLLVPTLIMGLSSPVAGKLSSHISARTLVVIGMLLLIGSTFWLSKLMVWTTTFYVFFWLSLRYAGIGLMSPVVNNYAMSAVPRELVGHASAMIGWARQLVTTLSLSVFTSILSLRIMIYTQTMPAVEQAAAIQCQAINDVTFYSLLILIACFPLVLGFKAGRKL